ncbi:SRPBCC family protein [Actinoplanes awajinensis]|uniref:Cyclase/dehydrase n=1 Tax=Actinoplanes awajinensis subsp. mycoplanecinus TaxID=135947 RepID=A0A0X3VDL1_9ACTN|nr:cyclase/dehydrase [Actinoplanes awajinensis subsp. mycoplanecinus]
MEVVSVVNAAPGTVFDLELDVDVHAASLAGSRETATTAAGRRRLGLGDEVTFRARHLGVWWRMTSRITAYDRPRRFVDEQTRGPFRSMRHEHCFENLGDGRTRMTDRMTVRAPLGALGAVVTRIVLTPYLKRLLKKRSVHIAHLAEAAHSRIRAKE